MLSNSGIPRGTSLHPCTSISELYSYSLISACFSCSLLSHSLTSSSSLTSTLTGSVLISGPTILSIPSIPAPLPDTTAPYTTSLSPEYRLITTAHAPCTIVLIVTCSLLLNPLSLSLTSSLIRPSSSPYPSSSSPPLHLSPPIRSTPSLVPSLTPLICSRQYSSALPFSCSFNHLMYSLYGLLLSSLTSSPLTSAPYLSNTSFNTIGTDHPSITIWW